MESLRLFYRPFEIKDAGTIFSLDSNPEVLRYLHQNTMNSKVEAEKVIKGVLKQYEENGIGRWMAIEKSSGKAIGWTGLKYETQFRSFPYYDIGYRYLPEFWKNGYGSEAAYFWRDYAFKELKIENLNATAHIDNIGSNKILQKIGMKITEEIDYKEEKCNWYELKNTAVKP